MMDVLLRLLGVWHGKSGHITEVHPTYLNEVPFYVTILLTAGLIAATFWLYNQTAQYVTPGRRYTLATLRSLFLVLLLLLVLRPVLVLTISGAVRQSLIVMVDTSNSMGVNERRTDQDDITRAAIARGDVAPEAGLAAKFQATGKTEVSRLQVAKDALHNEKLALLSRLEETYDIVPFEFNRTASEIGRTPPPVVEESTTGQSIASFVIAIGLIATVAGIGLTSFVSPRIAGLITTGSGIVVVVISFFVLDALDRSHKRNTFGETAIKKHATWVGDLKSVEGGSTAIGSSLREAITLKHGQSPAGVLLITDGQNNSGLSPLDAVKNEDIPVYVYGVGIKEPKDVSIPNVMIDPVVFVRDDAQVVVQIKANGLKGQTGKLVLKEITKEKKTPGDKDEERIIDSKEISLDNVDQVITLKFTPDQTRDFLLSAGIEPIDGETTTENNFARKRVRVVDTRIKVLQVEQIPRWEFHFLQGMLTRDRRVDYKCLLLEADPAVTQVPGSPYLRQPPVTVDEVQKYDLVILGDVDPKRLPAAFMESLKDAVDRLGVSVMVMAGKRFTPQAYRNTPIETILPVEFDQPRLGMTSITGNDKPLKLELTELGKTKPMLRLADNDEESIKRWNMLPPIYWTARITRAKVGAEVLLVDPDPAKQTRYGKMPVVAMKDYGRGSVLYVGTDNTWRWRKNLSEQDFTRFWGQMIERMALVHSLGDSKKTQLSSERQTYAIGDRIKVYARLYHDKDFTPYTEPTLDASYENAADRAIRGDFKLHAMPEQPGVYTGEFIATKPGPYRWHANLDANTWSDFSVTTQTIELTQTALNEASLKELAENTKGAFFREENLKSLPDTIQQKSQQRLSTLTVDFAFSPLYFLLLLTVVSAEWIIRKLSSLK
jgi:hypothetical protein